MYLAPLPDGPIQVLEGTGALIWSYALTVPRSRLADAVAADVQGDPAVINVQVVAFVDALLERGLLVEDRDGR